MTLTKMRLKELCESMLILLTNEQECVILEKFVEEPSPYEWEEQDIVEQIQKIIHDCPRPVKSLPDFLI